MTVNQHAFKYSMIKATLLPTPQRGTHSRWMVSNACLVLLGERDHNPTGLSVPLGCFCRKIHPILLSHASVPTDQWLCRHGKASLCGSTNLTFMASKPVISCQLICQRSAADLYVTFVQRSNNAGKVT